MQKSDWLKLWGYVEGTPEAEAAWAEKLAFRPARPKYVIGRSADYNYACPITNNPITSKRQHEENLKLHGCRVLEDGERRYNEKTKQAEEIAFERSIEDTVEREISVMPSEKREKLYNEMIGSDIKVERV